MIRRGSAATACVFCSHAGLYSIAGQDLWRRPRAKFLGGTRLSGSHLQAKVQTNWLRQEFLNDLRVEFTMYHPKYAVSIHRRHDIAVVPSLASEGTTFAVAEAMAAGCSVIATHVGGVTNMIVHNYNGLLVSPDAAALVAGLETLIHKRGHG